MFQLPLGFCYSKPHDSDRLYRHKRHKNHKKHKTNKEIGDNEGKKPLPKRIPLPKRTTLLKGKRKPLLNKSLLFFLCPLCLLWLLSADTNFRRRKRFARSIRFEPGDERVDPGLVVKQRHRHAETSIQFDIDITPRAIRIHV